MTRSTRRTLASTLTLALCLALAASAAASPLRITIYFGLKRPEAAARSAFFAVQQPGSPSYRRFLTVDEVAARYGATRSTRTAVVRALTRRGLSVRIDRSGVFARVRGTVAQLDRVFEVKIQRQFGNLPNVNVYFLKGNGRLNLPANMRSLVQDAVRSSTSAKASPRRISPTTLGALATRSSTRVFCSATGRLLRSLRVRLSPRRISRW